LNFTGNVEGGDIFEGTADVIVCDGFVGNILLKLFETYGTTFEKTFSKLISGNILYRFGAFLLQKPLTTYKETYNYERFGGIPLLGINGVALIGHGKSSPEAIKSAIFSALTMYERDIQGHIRKEIEQYKESI
jgi:glycerol-3-phosphate acyltransferase PlsX